MQPMAVAIALAVLPAANARESPSATRARPAVSCMNVNHSATIASWATQPASW